MQHLSPARLLLLLLLLAGCCLRPGVAGAQAPPWVLARINSLLSGGGESTIEALASDASGNVLVAGVYSNQVQFGGTTLTSRGKSDLFVAKYVPAANTWAWALSAGGTGDDAAFGIAVSGSNIYLTGILENDLANTKAVQFGTSSNGTGLFAQPGTASVAIHALFVAKYQDYGSSAALGWTQVAGGQQAASGNAIAVNGTSVYVVGGLVNDAANTTQFVLGGSGAVAGTVAQAGASSTLSADMLLVKYQDNGSSATVRWAQVAGGTGDDYGNNVAVSNNTIYVAGGLTNTASNATNAVFGASGLAPGLVAQAGATATRSNDIFLASYTDNNSSALLRWTQVAGGSDDDRVEALAVSGNRVYMTGSLFNDRANSSGVVFGGTGLVAGTQPQYGASTTNGQDAFLAKYIDQGASAAVAWTQVAGGASYDVGTALAVAGSSVYLFFDATNNLANSQGVVLGGNGSVAGTVPRPGTNSTVTTCLVAARYTDLGPSAAVGWTQVGGGAGSPFAIGCALAGQYLYAGGGADLPVELGPYAFAAPTAGFYRAYLLAALDLTGFLATSSPTAALALAVYPNPAAGAVHLFGATPATAGQVVDALGRQVATFTTDATGTAALPAGLAPGVYTVRAGAATGRWVVE